MDIGVACADDHAVVTEGQELRSRKEARRSLGAVISPVTRKSAEGLPLFYLRDIPPIADGGPKIHEPRIYFGEQSDDYVIIKGSTPEFDYPKGKDNAYAAYDGTGGVPIGAMAWRALFATYFNDPNLLLSNYITAGSRIMIRRDIQERVSTIAPFLGSIMIPIWLSAAGGCSRSRTPTRRPPISPPRSRWQDLDLNYIRNSVKMIVDAYNGTVDFYLINSGDPIAATYRQIFRACSSRSRRCHRTCRSTYGIRKTCSCIQARLYQAYRIEAADVFYNREESGGSRASRAATASQR